MTKKKSAKAVTKAKVDATLQKTADVACRQIEGLFNDAMMNQINKDIPGSNADSGTRKPFRDSYHRKVRAGMRKK